MYAERREYRLMFSNVDRGVSLERPLVLSRHSSESMAHLTLRVLAWVLLYEDGLQFGPGVCEGDEPDLVAHDMTGKVSTWVAVGDLSPKVARKILQHNREATVHLVFSDPVRRQEFLDEVASWGYEAPRGWDRLSLWSFEPALVAALAVHDGLRQRWSVTMVGDHVYVDAEGTLVDGPITRG